VRFSKSLDESIASCSIGLTKLQEIFFYEMGLKQLQRRSWVPSLSRGKLFASKQFCRCSRLRVCTKVTLVLFKIIFYRDEKLKTVPRINAALKNENFVCILFSAGYEGTLV
jgi:hypothetical protein